MSNQTKLNGSLPDVFKVTIPKTEAILFGIVFTLLTVLILAGNSLVCVAFWRFRNLRNLTNYFVCSLAVADFMVPVTRVIYVVISTFKGRWVFGLTWCEISSMCGVLLCGASILHLCAISIERLIAIKWPLTYTTKVTPKRVVISLSYIWVQSSLLSLIPALPVTYVKHRFNPYMADCEIDWRQDPKLTIFLLFFYFFVPVNIMLIAYAQIFKEARRNLRRVQTLQITVNGKSINKFKKELKAVKTLAVVIGAFFVMWMPFFVTNTIRAFKGEDFVAAWLQRAVMILAYANSGCNFVIYALMNFQYRRAFIQVLTNCTERRLMHSGDFPLQVKNSKCSLSRLSIRENDQSDAKSQ